MLTVNTSVISGVYCMKLSPAVKQTTALTAVGTAVCAVIMTVVYLLIGKWNTRVLFGTLLGSAVAVLNFFLMAVSVQQSVECGDADSAKIKMRSSRMTRTLIMTAAAVAAYFLSGVIDIIPLLICYIFPRVTITAKAVLDRIFRRDRSDADTDVENNQEKAD